MSDTCNVDIYYLCEMLFYKARRRSWHTFQYITAPHRGTVYRIINTVRHPLLGKKLHYRILVEEKVDETAARFEHSPQKSITHLAQKTGVSESSA
jgi:hypothetical protein